MAEARCHQGKTSSIRRSTRPEVETLAPSYTVLSILSDAAKQPYCFAFPSVVEFICVVPYLTLNSRTLRGSLVLPIVSYAESERGWRFLEF